MAKKEASHANELRKLEEERIDREAVFADKEKTLKAEIRQHENQI